MSSLGQTKACVVCGRPQVGRFHPFCSRRCADVDLHRWLSGAYAIPCVEDDEAEPRRPGSGRTRDKR